jgi:hypothetical protein
MFGELLLHFDTCHGSTIAEWLRFDFCR